jgi:hypothetical protein
LGIGILLSPLRRELLSRHRVLGSLIVLVMVIPHIIWQIRHGWPTLEFIRNASEHKIVTMSPADFWGEQLLMAHPGFLPIWLIGLIGLLFMRSLRTWRPLGVAFAVVGLWFTVSNAKPYYLVPAYPMVMAAGAVVITFWLDRWRRVARVTTIALPIILAAQGLLIAPMAIALLEPAAYVSYEQALGLRPKHAEQNAVGVLPQHFADRFGWEELARTVYDVIADLPEVDRSGILVVTGNYGECGAINYWGLPAGVAPALSGHNSCFFWWPEDFVPEIVVLVGGSRARAEQLFETVELGAVHSAEWAMPSEQELPIWVCRGWKVDPAETRAAARFAI